MAILKQTFADQAYQQLKSEIINGEIQAGTKITLKILQEKYNLSTTPLREAMNRLIGEGLLIHTTNVGANVITLNEKDIIELYDICRILDSNALTFAFNNNKKALKKSLLASIDAQKKSLDPMDIEIFNQASDGFHDIFYTYADNDRLYESSKRYRNQITILVNRYHSDPEDLIDIYNEHQAITDAIVNDDIDEAVKLFQIHFEIGKKTVLVKYKKL